MLPTGTVTAAHLHVPRFVCRRAERWVVALQQQHQEDAGADDEDDEAIAEQDQHRQRYLKRRYDFFFTAQCLSIIVRDKPVKYIIVENIMAVLVLFPNKNINESRRRWRPQVPTNN
jgi:hypothetical protein